VEFVGDADTVVAADLAGRGEGNAFDEVGHSHLDVQFDEVGERVELNVSGEPESVSGVVEDWRQRT
jgi:hypothetical protein